MSYFAFHLVFTYHRSSYWHWFSGSLLLVSEDSEHGWVAADCLLALVYTTPWDNYLIWRDVWHYGTDRVVGTIDT